MSVIRWLRQHVLVEELVRVFLGLPHPKHQQRARQCQRHTQPRRKP